MKFIYGKQDWKTFERGEENCYLMTNGLGGFSSLTMTGSCSRNDHSVLMACVHSPNQRYNMIHRLEEILYVGEEKVYISSQDYEGHEKREEGYLFQSGFSYEDYPQWTYLVKGVEIVKTLVLGQGENTVGISYEINNRSGREAVLEVFPHLQFVPKGSVLPKEQKFTVEGNKISAGGLSVYFQTDGEAAEIPVKFFEDLYYAYDACDGRCSTGRSVVNHRIWAKAPAGEVRLLHMVYGMREPLPTVEELRLGVTAYRDSLRRQAGFKSPAAQALSLAANQFVSHRNSTGKQTILAGFPFFEDWGRDTMIALNGCCLSTRQYETAKSILETFMAYCNKGLMPNLFPEGGKEPRYNTVDASLLFILTVYEYYKMSGDKAFVKSAWKTMTDIVDWYRKGTDFGIGMDTDGLIMAGRDFDQVTWMDVRVGDILPTPRHGKPVEINAYWYNALCIMDELKGIAGGDGHKSGLSDSLQEQRCTQQDKWDYASLAAKVKESFELKFWNEETGCLKDVLSGTKADNQIRCNQIWAVSLPFAVLSAEREKQVVDMVFEKLYTPYGLRTLDPEDEEFHPVYGGELLERDLAYHQGTVWTFPLGAYYLAYLKVNGYSREAKEWVDRALEGIEAALREGCIGQLPEIYDGENPVSSKGCFAQAWSVGEILRVYDVLEK